MTLADLLAAACRGDGPLPLDSAARLYGAVADNLDAGDFGSATDTAEHLPVTVEKVEDGLATVDVYGLRYLVDLEVGGGSETVSALCTVPDCPEAAMTRTRFARVCRAHWSHWDPLSAWLLGYPPPSDVQVPGWEEEERRKLTGMRADMWRKDLDRREQELELERGMFDSIRHEVNA